MATKQQVETVLGPDNDKIYKLLRASDVWGFFLLQKAQGLLAFVEKKYHIVDSVIEKKT